MKFPFGAQSFIATHDVVAHMHGAPKLMNQEQFKDRVDRFHTEKESKVEAKRLEIIKQLDRAVLERQRLHAKERAMNDKIDALKTKLFNCTAEFTH